MICVRSQDAGWCDRHGEQAGLPAAQSNHSTCNGWRVPEELIIRRASLYES